ncbi:hypothetical protein Adt_27049 [Abeliophyllum distichum]|uniref:Uncharacterized protein n=1 Tax=Abeliophyllum distichum TaxID=126358 RepID=A0ABD1RSN3_9LAMI
MQDLMTRINELLESVSYYVDPTQQGDVRAKLVDSRSKLDLCNEHDMAPGYRIKKHKMVSQMKVCVTGVVSDPKSPRNNNVLELDIVFSKEDLRLINELAEKIRISNQVAIFLVLTFVNF